MSRRRRDQYLVAVVDTAGDQLRWFTGWPERPTFSTDLGLAMRFSHEGEAHDTRADLIGEGFTAFLAVSVEVDS